MQSDEYHVLQQTILYIGAKLHKPPTIHSPRIPLLEGALHLLGVRFLAHAVWHLGGVFVDRRELVARRVGPLNDEGVDKVTQDLAGQRERLDPSKGLDVDNAGVREPEDLA